VETFVIYLQRSFKGLPPNIRRKALNLFVFQIALSILDLIAIYLMSILITKAFDDRTGRVFGIGFNKNMMEILNGFSTITIVSICVLSILLKNLLNVFIARKLFTTLSEFNVEFSRKKMNSYLNGNWQRTSRLDVEKLTYAFTDGINAITIGVIGNSILAASELCLLVLILILLGSAEFALVAFSIVFFALIVFGINRFTSPKVMNAGKTLAKETMTGRGVISDTQSIYREINTSDKREFFLNRFMQSKELAAKAYADSDFLQQLPKYILESSSILGVVILYLLSSITAGNTNAMQISLMFLAATTRIIPSILRLQGYLLSFKRSVGYAHEAQEIFNLIDEQHQLRILGRSGQPVSQIKSRNGSIEFYDVDFKYSESGQYVVKNCNLKISPNELVALIGESGAGKSTLCDLILGYLTPTSGHILLSGIDPTQTNSSEIAKVVYLPQNAELIRGTIFENVTLKKADSDVDVENCKIALQKASILEFVLDLSNGIQTQIGEGGLKLSGGQAQRIALARAIYCEPQILILDEPMASIDDKTSRELELHLNHLKSLATILVVTHKVIDPKNYDQILEINA